MPGQVVGNEAGRGMYAWALDCGEPVLLRSFKLCSSPGGSCEDLQMGVDKQIFTVESSFLTVTSMESGMAQ